MEFEQHPGGLRATVEVTHSVNVQSLVLAGQSLVDPSAVLASAETIDSVMTTAVAELTRERIENQLRFALRNSGDDWFEWGHEKLGMNNSVCCDVDGQPALEVAFIRVCQRVIELWPELREEGERLLELYMVGEA
jgi:hypothetical protein